MEVRTNKSEFSKALAVLNKVARKGRVWYLGYIGMEAGEGGDKVAWDG
jgi:hypothetical protein